MADPGGVLIVEEQAHWEHGHFPVRFAQLATAYAQLGYEVEVLTTWGWARKPVEDQPFVVHRFGVLARNVRRVAGRLRGFGDSTRSRRVVNTIGDALATAAMVGATRRRVARMTRFPTAVIVMGWDTEPAAVAALAGPGRWLINQFKMPEQVFTWRTSLVTQTVRSLARHAEARREAHRGCVRVAAADEVWRATWERATPFLRPVVLPIAGVRPFDQIPDARARLGLPDDARVALLFGDADGKRVDTVVTAFAELPDWTLVVGGKVADAVPRHPSGHAHVVRFEGVVSDETRDLLLAAADVMVLSFFAGYRRNSGTLMDAVSAGIPTVCSRDSAAAELVEHYSLGPLFDPDDASSLADAIRRVVPLPLEVIERAQRALSNAGVARQQLSALGVDD